MKALALLPLVFASALAQAGPLFDNGPAVGPDGIKVVGSVGNRVASTSFDAGVADDFTVTDAGGWRITDFDLFSYQYQNTAPGVTPLFLYTNVVWSIVRGDLNTGEVVASDTGIPRSGGVVGYSVFPNDLTSKREAIWDIKVNIPDIDLAAGHYWLTWAFTTSFGTPNMTTVYGDPVGNAQNKFRSSVYFPTQSPDGIGAEFPFILNGSVIPSTVTPVPEPTTTALMLGGLGLLAAVGRRRLKARA